MANKYIFHPHGITLPFPDGDIVLNAGPGITIQPQGNILTFSAPLPANVVINAFTPYQPVQMTDAKAANNTVYYSATTSKLCFKDPSGGIHTLY